MTASRSAVTPGAPTVIDATALGERLGRDDAVTVLDVRRPERWCEDDERIPGAVWIPHDDVHRRARDLPADRDLVVYCSCPGAATSTRVARWLLAHGFPSVAVLQGGLEGWRRAGLATEPFVGDGRSAAATPAGVRCAAAGGVSPSLAERHLQAGVPATRVRLATLFVDIAGSTRLLAHHSPETVLVCIQRFMRLVTEVTLAYCGDIKDFEGDGALLYFESASEAVEAGLAIRTALAQGVCDVACPVSARMSVTVGDVVLGVVGSELRHTVALVGPSVTVGARLLKQIAPGGIITTGEVVEALHAEMPDLARDFNPLDPAFTVPATDGIVVATWALGPRASDCR